MGLNNISPYIFIVLKFTNQEKGLWLCPYCEQIIHIYASNVFNIDVLEHDINIFSATHSGGKEFAVTSSPLRYSCKSTVYFPVTLSHRINAACIEKVWLCALCLDSTRTGAWLKCQSSGSVEASVPFSLLFFAVSQFLLCIIQYRWISCIPNQIEPVENNCYFFHKQVQPLMWILQAELKKNFPSIRLN